MTGDTIRLILTPTIYNRFREATLVKRVHPVYIVQYYSTQKPGQRSANLPRQYSVGVRRRVKSTTVVERYGPAGKTTQDVRANSHKTYSYSGFSG